MARRPALFFGAAATPMMTLIRRKPHSLKHNRLMPKAIGADFDAEMQRVDTGNEIQTPHSTPHSYYATADHFRAVPGQSKSTEAKLL